MTTTPTPAKPLTMFEVADRTGLPLSTLRYWRLHPDKGGPRSFNLGRRVAYLETDVDAWIESQRAAGVGEDLAAVG